MSPLPVPNRSAPSVRDQLSNGSFNEAPVSPNPIQTSLPTNPSTSTQVPRNIRTSLAHASSSSRSPGLSNSGNQNVTVIEVADSQHTPCDIFNFNFVRDAVPLPEGETEPLEQFFTPPATPRSRASIAHPPQADQSTPTTSPPSRLWQQITQVVSNLIGQPSQSEVIRVTQGVTNITIPSQQETSLETQNHNSSVYEHVYPITGNDSVFPGTVEESRRRDPAQHPPQPSVRQVAVEHQHRRRRTSSGSEILNPRSRSAANVLRHAASDVERRLHPVPHPFRQVRFLHL